MPRLTRLDLFVFTVIAGVVVFVLWHHHGSETQSEPGAARTDGGGLHTEPS